MCLVALLATTTSTVVASAAQEAWRPPAPVPGWQVARPEAVGVNAELLSPAVVALRRQPGVDCILVARSGLLLAEIGDGACRQPHNIQSASKSILGLLVGIAIDNELLPEASTPLSELLPQLTADLSTDKQSITLEHLLTMKSGLTTTSGAAYGAWVTTGDWSRAALKQVQEQPPGAGFTYSTGNSHLLATVLRRAVGADLLSWSTEVLFEPLGVTVDGWDRSPEGVRFGGNSFAITPFELLRIGQLVLDEGRHQGRQLISESWLQRSFTVHAEGWPDRYGAYGYLWWLRPDVDPLAVLAVGYGGQFLYLVPELELGIVVTANNQGKGAAWDRRVLGIIEQDLLRSIEGR